MLFILNFLMNISYNNDLNAAVDILSQTAISNVPNVNSEIIMLDDLSTDKSGNYIIERNPRTIQSITINGSIQCMNDEAEWFCAGGGILFAFPYDSEEPTLIHKEYQFHERDAQILIDFTDDSTFMYDSKPISASINDVSEKYFCISPVWWSMASTSYDNHNADVNLELKSIEIQFRDDQSAASNINYQLRERDFSDIYSSGTPYTLNTFKCFYIIDDKQNHPIEFNSGNTELNITNKNVVDLLQNSSYDDVEIDNTDYKYYTSETEHFNIHIFIHNVLAEKNGRQLLIVSALSGGVVLILVLIIIYFASGKAIAPIKESYDKQNEFISNASHELKTPITVISATTQLMEKKIGSDRLLSCIQSQSQKMSRLINEMLTLTRTSNFEQYTNEFQQFNISKTVNNNVLYFESRAFEMGKQFKTDIQEDINFYGNQNKVEELIGILLDNALKYSDDNSVIEVELHSEKDKVVLICRNKCQNFDENDIPHLFERFYRGDKSHSTRLEGFGLGLSIAGKIVDLHKGTINVSYKDNFVVFKIKM